MTWPCRRRAPAWPQGGFTLIETIVVLTILGLAAAIVIGFIPRRNTTLELADAASRTAGAMRLARSIAITENRSVAFAATPDGRGYRTDNARVALGPSVTVAMAGPSLIMFAPDGSASGGSLRVSAGGKSRLVTVDWLTGRVTVSDAP